jgi:hypothetical protein
MLYGVPGGPTIAPMPADTAQDDLEQQPLPEDGLPPPEDEIKDDAEDGTPPGDDVDGEEGDEDELTITIGDAPAAPEEDGKAPPWVRELRKQNKEKDRVIRELQNKLAAKEPAPTAVVVGEKPTLESVDYDAEKFSSELEAWHERRRQAEAQREESERKERADRDAWQQRLQSYDQAKAKLKVRDFASAEDAVSATFSTVQQGIILSGADAPERVIYALGKNPAEAKRIAGITDPVKFSFAVAKLETKLKVERRRAPAPEELPRGGSGGAGAAVVDNQLERLRLEAEKTGDYSKVHEFKQQLRAKQQQRAA